MQRTWSDPYLCMGLYLGEHHSKRFRFLPRSEINEFIKFNFCDFALQVWMKVNKKHICCLEKLQVRNKVHKECHLFYGQLLAGSTRNLWNLFPKLIQAKFYDSLQGKCFTGMVKGSLNLFATKHTNKVYWSILKKEVLNNMQWLLSYHYPI